MYSRKENIEAEHIDWESHTSPSPFKSEEDKEFDYIGGKKRDFLDENLKLVFLFSFLLFPYVIGFLLFYFVFFVYGGMNIIDFIMMQQGSFYFASWATGMYLLLTAGIIGVLVKSGSGSFKK